LHNELDKELNKKFGWKVRSEGVFTTSSKSHASVYGKPYIFFPDNSFKYVFNPEITDLYTELIGVGALTTTDKININIWNVVKHKIIDGYQSNNLIMAFQNSKEVSFKCKYYYLIHELFIRELIDGQN
jgi:hypothetical protein